MKSAGNEIKIFNTKAALGLEYKTSEILRTQIL